MPLKAKILIVSRMSDNGDLGRYIFIALGPFFEAARQGGAMGPSSTTTQPPMQTAGFFPNLSNQKAWETHSPSVNQQSFSNLLSANTTICWSSWSFPGAPEGSGPISFTSTKPKGRSHRHWH